MNVSFSAARDGMNVSVTRHDITAHDVANINTPGFEQSTPYQTEKAPQGVRISHVGRTPNSAGAPSNTDLAQEAGEMITNKNVNAANAKVMKVQNRMIGDLLDMVG